MKTTAESEAGDWSDTSVSILLDYGFVFMQSKEQGEDSLGVGLQVVLAASPLRGSAYRQQMVMNRMLNALPSRMDQSKK
jgi:hypothetical protein